MQIAILVEQMRREGYEILVSRPEVIYRKDKDGNLLEPIEKLFRGNAEGKHRRHHGESRRPQRRDHQHELTSATQVSIEALVPTRGLIGFETDLVNDSHGMGVMSHLFNEYGADRGEIAARKNGSLVSMEDGEATSYALNMVQERGRLMVLPGESDLRRNDRW